jgi:hypothetical protein
LNGKREKAGHWGAALSLVLIRDLSEPISRFDWSRKSGREGLLDSNTAGATLAVGGGKILTYGNHSVAGTPGSGFTGSAALQIAVRIGAGQVPGRLGAVLAGVSGGSFDPTIGMCNPRA